MDDLPDIFGLMRRKPPAIFVGAFWTFLFHKRWHLYKCFWHKKSNLSRQEVKLQLWLKRWWGKSAFPIVPIRRVVALLPP
jgi:hypothetical protein